MGATGGIFITRECSWFRRYTLYRISFCKLVSPKARTRSRLPTLLKAGVVVGFHSTTNTNTRVTLLGGMMTFSQKTFLLKNSPSNSRINPCSCYFATWTSHTRQSSHHGRQRKSYWNDGFKRVMEK